MIHGETVLTLRGTGYPLLYSGRAHWALKELLEGRDLLEVLACKNVEDYKMAWMATGVLSSCHAVASRVLGEKPGTLLDYRAWPGISTPDETVAMVAASTRAVRLGFEQKHRHGEIDKGLAALRKKQGVGVATWPQYLRMGLVNGLDVPQILSLTPGTLFDLWELYLDASGRRAKED